MHSTDAQIQVLLANVSEEFAQVALQGPKAEILLAEVLDIDPAQVSLKNFPPYTLRQEKFSALNAQADDDLIVARTGYTGEDGFEIFLAPKTAPVLWRRILELGQKYSIQPIGLGARDTLRLEVCYPLYGHELKDDISALSCRVNWVIKFDKEDFIGKEALLEDRKNGTELQLVGIEVEGRGIVRAEVALYAEDLEIGWVTSGTQTPTVARAIGLAFVKKQYAKPGQKLEALIRSRRVPVKVCKPPFYAKDGS